MDTIWWVVGYFVGMLLTSFVVGLATVNLKEDDVGPLIGGLLFWPVTSLVILLWGAFRLGEKLRGKS